MNFELVSRELLDTDSEHKHLPGSATEITSWAGEVEAVMVIEWHEQEGAGRIGGRVESEGVKPFP